MSRIGARVAVIGVVTAFASASGPIPLRPNMPDDLQQSIIDPTTAVRDGWVKLYDDQNFSDRVLTVAGGTDFRDLDQVRSDDDRKGFGDKATSVRWSIPPGWQCVLYEDKDWKGRAYPLRGKGEDPNLGDFGDEASSIRWERYPANSE